MAEWSRKVDAYLNDFKIKSKLFGILFKDDRGKNFQALLDLDLRPNDRIKILDDLKAQDYIEGPIDDNDFLGSDLWVFGKKVKAEDVYIKVSMGKPNQTTICISFHIAERPVIYPLK